MKYWKLMLAILISMVLTAPVRAEEQEEKSNKLSYEERIKQMEDTFWAAQKAGKTVRGVFVEGNSLFNGTTSPQTKPFGNNYTEEELLGAQMSAERNSKLFLLAEDGTLYYPTCKKGQRVSQSDQAHRIPRVLSEKQKTKKTFTWATQVPMTGRIVEVYGEVYPGYAGIKGIDILSIYFEGEYLVGVAEQEQMKKEKNK